jgi:hypothetical protein
MQITHRKDIIMGIVLSAWEMHRLRNALDGTKLLHHPRDLFDIQQSFALLGRARNYFPVRLYLLFMKYATNQICDLIQQYTYVHRHVSFHTLTDSTDV